MNNVTHVKNEAKALPGTVEHQPPLNESPLFKTQCM